jgi:hypothetical protein
MGGIRPASPSPRSCIDHDLQVADMSSLAVQVNPPAPPGYQRALAYARGANDCGLELEVLHITGASRPHLVAEFSHGSAVS